MATEKPMTTDGGAKGMNIRDHILAGHYPCDGKGRALVPMKDQRTATICAKDGPEGEELVGWYSDSHLGRPAVCSWQDNGCWQIKSCRLDLLPPPPRKAPIKVGLLYTEQGWMVEFVNCGDQPARGTRVQLTGEYEEPWI